MLKEWYTNKTIKETLKPLVIHMMDIKTMMNPWQIPNLIIKIPSEEDWYIGLYKEILY